MNSRRLKTTFREEIIGECDKQFPGRRWSAELSRVNRNIWVIRCSGGPEGDFGFCVDSRGPEIESTESMVRRRVNDVLDRMAVGSASIG